MKTCKRCFAVIDEEAVKCPYCGEDQKINPDSDLNGASQPEMFNGGAVVENIPAPKKKKSKISLAGIIGIIIGIAVAIACSNILSGTFSANKIEAGIADESGYTNSSVDLRIDCPDGWEIVTGTELAEMTNSAVAEDGSVKNSEGLVYECMMSSDIGENIIIAEIDGNIIDALTSTDDFIDDLTDSFSEDSIISQNFEMQIGGNKYNCISADSVIQNINVKQTVCAVKEKNEYFVIIFTLYPDYSDFNADEMIEDYFKSAE